MAIIQGIGHACGHNLIAIAGVGVALAVKAALVEHDITGTVVFLGTPGLFTLYPIERFFNSRTG
jgi:metal-dependent amidase/aminoacylase/carboxypeptidase family protein